MNPEPEFSDAERKYGALGLEASRFENIPRSLQSAGFLQWSVRADRPRQPHREGDFGISWSDPDDWMRFDEAVESADTKEPWGIGYLNALENSDLESGHRMTIDIDGAIKPNGELREWVPSLEPFFERGAYVEVSPSYAEILMEKETDGAGIHIPVKNAELADWWSDSEVADDLHQGVDVLANKFCTVTGVKHPQSGGEVVEYGKWMDEWLAEAYRNIRGESPRRNRSIGEDGSGSSDRQDGGSGGTNQTFTTGKAAREDVESALDNVGHAAGNPLSYDDWTDIAYAVHAWDEESTGREVFDDWTKESPKYESPDSVEPIDWIWENADAPEDGGDDSKISVGTLFHEAKKNGWDGPENTRVDFDPAAEWGSWHTNRVSGELGPDSIIPEVALQHIAEDRELYDFEAVEDADLETLPPKAHTRALAWVKNEWADEFLEEDEEATARSYKTADAVVYTWEDVRYIYEKSKERGRQAARELLSDRYEFMTVADTDTLHIYDEDRGIFTDKTGMLRGEIYEQLGEHWSTHELNEIVAGLRQENVVEPRDLNAGDREEALLCVSNGVLNLYERELHEHSPDYQFVSQVPVEYDPDAETETYEDFVGEIVDRPVAKDALFEMVGHALVPDANERYKKFLILTGDADNGKSVFYHAVETLLNGPDGMESNTAGVKLAKLAQNRFSIYSMYGSLANIAGEIDGKKIRNTANLKDITGGDEVEIEPKGQDSFFDSLGTTLMFAANDPPILGERDKKAIATRIVPIELPYTFVEDPQSEYEKQLIPERELKAELDHPEAVSGFLNLALDGLERLKENGGDVSLPESPEERLEDYEQSADPMREFGDVALENDPGDYVVKADVTTLYKEFASSRGYEVGSNIGPVLHGVLRGQQSLNYTDSKPRNPDYTDTSLPLKGWSERKEVVDRVTLTDEGLKLAEAAGLVVDESEQVEQSHPEDALAALEPGYGHSFRAEVFVVSDGEYSREAQGQLKGPAGTVIGFVIPGDNELKLRHLEGEAVELENVRIRTDDDSLKEAVITDATSFEKVESLAKDDSSDTSTESGETSGSSATADGGKVLNEELDDAIERWTTAKTDGAGANREELAAAVADDLGLSTQRVEDRIDTLIQKDRRIYRVAPGTIKTKR
jgi:putative DNA primase/helicase